MTDRWGEPAPARGAETIAYKTIAAASAAEIAALDAAERDCAGATTERDPADSTTDGRHDPAEAPAIPDEIGGRYARLALLGRGGMGEVWRVRDTWFGRTVALKVLHGPTSPRAWARFEEEARIAAQLQHPGIIPVHDMGNLPDGRMWFTMKEVRGRTLESLIGEVHRAWRLGRDTTVDGWTFRRLLEGFLRVCETMAYAHARGVAHRDIKPSNLMFGQYGEVLVLDWGLAKVLGEAHADEEAVHTGVAASETRQGVISGTPNYMSPEQAQGRSAEAGARADVYALGATLYDLLAERPPRLAKSVQQLLFQVATGHPPIAPPSSHRAGFPIDPALDALVLRALAVEEADRYPTAAGLADELSRWLDGAEKRERAMHLVADANACLRRASALRQEAEVLAGRAAAALDGVPAEAEVADKLAGWALQDDGADRARQARDERARAIQQLRAALTHAPDLPEAHAGLASLFVERHAELEAAGRDDEARDTAAEIALHDRDGAHARYLSGEGALTLLTDVPAAVELLRFAPFERRLVPERVGDLGSTPLIARPLPMGSYLLVLRAPGRAEVRLPVWIRRNEHWDHVPPEGGEPVVIRLPLADALAPDDLWVPPGWFWCGDDEFDHTLPLRRVWSDGFVLKRFPVTIGEYVDYLNALLDAGDESAADAAQPRFGGSVAGDPYFARDADGRFLGMAPDLPGLEAFPRRRDLPMTVVTWDQAVAYSAWRAAREGLPWRLPMEMERQHAGRGADRRMYPWGDHHEPTWNRMRSARQPGSLVPVTRYPVDEGPYGHRGLAGNSFDWVADAATDVPLPRAVCRVAIESGMRSPTRTRRVAVGGSFMFGPRTCYVSSRSWLEPSYRGIHLGLRLSRSLG